MDIGHRMKELRIQYGLTQQELADRAELTKGFISQLERNQNSPSIGTLLDIISASAQPRQNPLPMKNLNRLCLKLTIILKRSTKKRTAALNGLPPMRRKMQWNLYG